jgi:DNA polymerase-1
MLTNIGYKTDVEAITNWCDTQAVARLALEALSARDGGDKLGLKPLGVHYVDAYASNSSELIDAEMTQLRKARNKVLASVLKQFDHPTETTIKYTRNATGKGTTRAWYELNQSEASASVVPRKWTMKHIETLLKDPTLDLEDLPEGVRDVWLDWQAEYPEPTYADIDMKVMHKYAGEDIVTMMMLVQYFFPIIIIREQMDILKLEMDCILPTYRMERVGLKTDVKHLEESRLKVKAYIIKLRNELYELVNEKVTVGQHERLKQIFNEKWDIALEGCDKVELRNVENNFEGEPKRFAQLISRLRTLEKWYSTYIVAVQKNASFDGRAYTQINLNGAVSGRMSSNFQQFPRGDIKTFEGEVLYNPRESFLTDGDMVFID